MKFYKLLALLSVGVAGAFPTACTDKYEDMENHMPSWLNSNIYDYLSGRGDGGGIWALADAVALPLGSGNRGGAA